VSKVISLKYEPAAPARSQWLAGHNMLVMLFDDEPGLRPFIKYLLDAHGVISVSQWDNAGGVRLFDGFPLDEASKNTFLQKVGVPRRCRTLSNAKVVQLYPGR
jgi:hypothetical protein